MKGARVKKKLPIKRHNRMKKKKNIRSLIRGICNYLKSDSYFYSNLISSWPFDSSPLQEGFSSLAGLSISKPMLANEGKLKDQLVEYLKSDTYMYAPLEESQTLDHFAVKNVISTSKGHDLQFKRVTSTILSRKVFWQTKQVADVSVGKKQGDHNLKNVSQHASVLHPQTPAKKQPIRRSDRLSTIPGKGGIQGENFQ